MDKSAFCLFYSLPLDAQDWASLTASHVKRVMLMLPFADQATLARLNSMGVSVTLRCPEDAYYDDLAPLRIRNAVQACASVCKVDAVIVGVEPESEFDFTYGSPTWGAERAYAHREAFTRVMTALKAAGFAVASPGWRIRAITEDDPPQPGEAQWAEICRLQYDRADYNAVHIYEHAWDGPVNEWRFKTTLRELEKQWHKMLLIDEIGINHGTQIERMRGYLDIAQLLLTHPLGKRVAMLCPFVANGNPGNPPSWSPNYVIRDPAAYTLLAHWIQS